MCGTHIFSFYSRLSPGAPKRNCNGNADASKWGEATQAFGNHSEVYNIYERARLQAHASPLNRSAV